MAIIDSMVLTSSSLAAAAPQGRRRHAAENARVRTPRQGRNAPNSACPHVIPLDPACRLAQLHWPAAAGPCAPGVQSRGTPLAKAEAMRIVTLTIVVLAASCSQ